MLTSVRRDSSERRAFYNHIKHFKMSNQSIYDNCNVTLDEYSLDNGVYNCYCYIMTPDGQIDQEHAVTMQEMRDFVCDDGMVSVTNPNDTQETEAISFDEWLQSVDRETLCNELAMLINIRDKRKSVASVLHESIMQDFHNIKESMKRITDSYQAK